jgi:hypothetical protein
LHHYHQDFTVWGSILLVFAFSLLTLAFPAIRKNLSRLIMASPQGLIILLVGVCTILITGQYVPFLVAVITSAACYLMIWDTAARNVALWINKLPLIKKIKGISVSNFLLCCGTVAFLISSITVWSLDIWHNNNLTKLESDVLVAITIPGLNTRSSYATARDKDVIDRIQQEYFVTFNSLLHNSFDHLGEKLELLPVINPSDDVGVKSILNRLETLRDKPHIIASYREGEGSPIDLLIEPYFWLSSHEPTPRINYQFCVHRVDRDKLELNMWPGAQDECLDLDGIQDNHRLAAIVAISKVLLLTADKNLHEGKLSRNEYNQLWEKMIWSFKEHYKVFDHTQNERPEDWLGHSLANDPNCTGRTCVKDWIKAYSEILSDEKTAEDFQRSLNRTSATIVQSAQDGAK